MTEVIDIDFLYVGGKRNPFQALKSILSCRGEFENCSGDCPVGDNF